MLHDTCRTTKLHSGFVPFITKYFEYQHQLDSSTATLATGIIALLSVIVGCPLGAWFLNKFSWTPMRCAHVCGVVFTISSFLFLFLTLSCPELKFEQSSCTTSNTACCNNIYHPGIFLFLIWTHLAKDFVYLNNFL